MAKETYYTHMQDVEGVSGDRAYILILDVDSSDVVLMVVMIVVMIVVM